VLAVPPQTNMLGVPPASPAAWALPASYAVITGIGLTWGLVLKLRRPGIYASIGLGPYAVPGQAGPVLTSGAWS
jgi:hypothetical protein